MAVAPVMTDLVDRLAELSDRVRLRLLRLLECEELSVGEIATVLQTPQSTASRHLKVLSRGGWLVHRSEKTATLYRLVLDALSGETRSLWLAVREQLSGTPEADEDARRLKMVLAARATDSLSFFGRVAGEWDALRRELFGDGFTALGLLSLIPPEWTVADVGCGTGNLSALLAPVVARVIAVDQSGPMLEAAERRLGAGGLGLGNVTFLAGSAEALPLADASVDAVVCSLMLHHLDDPGAAVAEMARALNGARGGPRGGGLMLVIDMQRHTRESYRHTMGHRHLGFGEDEMKEMFVSAGLEPVRHVPLPGAPEGKGPGLFAASARLVGRVGVG